MDKTETVLVCPLGAECRTVKDNKIYQCHWYIKLVGRDPQSMKEHDEWGCAMAWTPILLVENARTNQGQTEALESFRNEIVEGNNQFLGLINQAKALK